MLKQIGLGVLVSMALLGFGAIVSFIAMVALNGFSEREGARIMMGVAALFFAAHFFIVSAVAKSRRVGGVITAVPAVPVFGLLAAL
ncbi:MAG: hypothetical protein JNK82_41775 [Myxococcaceae bacterium]|nr:hypothetical protein [Myxococcaceae bacterium]